MAGPLDEVAALDQGDEQTFQQPVAPANRPLPTQQTPVSRAQASVYFSPLSDIAATMPGRVGNDYRRQVRFQQGQYDRSLRLQDREERRQERQQRMVEREQDRTQRQQDRADRQAASANRLKAQDLSERGIPYFRNESGDVSEVTDDTGAPLLHHDKVHGIA